jgi:3-oxoacyl-(acyl-carrier-protein) synthase
MSTYITSSGLISPFDPAANITGRPGEKGGTHRCIEPEYRQLIDPVRLRRMSRILRLGLGAAQLCLNRACNARPDAILVGTGLACVNELDAFLSSMVFGNELGLSPIPFINSSHNTVAAQISRMLQNHSYNATYCHRGVSFESALTDAMMLIGAREASNVLLGGIDEFSSHYHTLMQQIDETGMDGEGAAFFLLGPRPESAGDPRVAAVRTFYRADLSGTFDARTLIDDFLADNHCDLRDTDSVVLGLNGDRQGDAVYHLLMDSFFPATTRLVAFKHLCGEYMTSGSFAFALAAEALRNGCFPAASLIRQDNGNPPQRVLLFYHYRQQNYALVLLERES